MVLYHDGAVAVRFKVDPNVVVQGFVVAEFHASFGQPHLNLLRFQVGAGAAVGIGRLDYAKRDLVGQLQHTQFLGEKFGEKASNFVAIEQMPSSLVVKEVEHDAVGITVQTARALATKFELSKTPKVKFVMNIYIK